MSEMKRSFHQKGDVVVVKTTVENEDLKPKDILQTIQNFEQELQKMDQQLVQMEAQRSQIEKNKAHTQELFKDISKYKSWAETYQDAKAKQLIPEIAEKIKAEIEKDFKPENGEQTEEQIKQTKWLQLQTRLSTHPEVSENLNQEHIRKYIYTEPLVANPF